VLLPVMNCDVLDSAIDRVLEVAASERSPGLWDPFVVCALARRTISGRANAAHVT